MSRMLACAPRSSNKMGSSWEGNDRIVITVTAGSVTTNPKTRTLAQIRAIVFLCRQGITLRGNTEKERNLSQPLQAMSKNNAVIRAWLRNNRFTSHQAVNELINSLGVALLPTLLKKVISVTGPSWFSIIADEATDVMNTEQLNLSIRWVADDYDIHEDPLGLYRVPDTKAETLFTIIKDLLIRCNLPVS